MSPIHASITRTRKSVEDRDWPLYAGIQARQAVYFESYAQLPEHVVDSLFRLRQQGFLKFDVAECEGRFVMKATPRLDGESPGELDLPEQWRAWAAE